MWALYVFTLLQMSFEVHGKQGRTAGIIWAAHRPVVTAHLMISEYTNSYINTIRLGHGTNTQILFDALTQAQQLESNLLREMKMQG